MILKLIWTKIYMKLKYRKAKKQSKHRRSAELMQFSDCKLDHKYTNVTPYYIYAYLTVNCAIKIYWMLLPFSLTKPFKYFVVIRIYQKILLLCLSYQLMHCLTCSTNLWPQFVNWKVILICNNYNKIYNNNNILIYSSQKLEHRRRRLIYSVAVKR